MRVAIYSRYSSDSQREASIEDQIRICRERCEREGWEITQVYTDYAVSGSSLNRPGVMSLIKDGKLGAFDLIVAEALDRISRDQADIANVYKQLGFYGVKMFTLSEGEINELHIGLKGTMNALFIKDLAAKTHRGMRGRVEAGKSAGGKCYGYDVVRRIGADGEPIYGERSINETEAAIVGRIFEDYAAGQSPIEIARSLNQEGIPGPNGESWGDSTIRGHYTRCTGILRNELYVGQMVWNRQRYMKNPDTGKRISKPNPRALWIREEVPELRVVSQELWDKAHRMLEAQRLRPGVVKLQKPEFWKRRRPQNMLTGLVVCGECGGTLFLMGKDYLACRNARRKALCTNRASIRRSVLEEHIFSALKTDMLDDELLKEFSVAFASTVKTLAATSHQDSQNAEKRIKEVDRKLDGLIEVLMGGNNFPTIREKVKELEEEKLMLQSQQVSAPAPVIKIPRDLLPNYKSMIEGMAKSLGAPELVSKTAAIMRQIVRRVEMKPCEEGIILDLESDLPSLIGLAANMKNAMDPGFKKSSDYNMLASSVKVVAGARFELTTFRL